MLSASYEQVKAKADQLFARQPIEAHPFVEALRHDRLEIEQARIIALQIYHVVDSFPRFLAALLAKVPSWQLRMPLVENLFEEHGRMDPKAVHVETYKLSLAALDLTSADLEASRPSISVLAYTRAVTDLCLHYPYPEGLGALGVIEEIVARVSPIVAGYFRRRTHTAEQGDLVHFQDHEVLDITHANELYELASRAWEAGHQDAVERGLELGMYYHRRLYTDLIEASA